jgi:hypothetical protein
MEKGEGEEIAAAAAEEGMKQQCQQRKKKRKEVFPFGNYRNYYGYRVIFFLILFFSLESIFVTWGSISFNF